MPSNKQKQKKRAQKKENHCVYYKAFDKYKIN